MAAWENVAETVSVQITLALKIAIESGDSTSAGGTVRIKEDPEALDW